MTLCNFLHAEFQGTTCAKLMLRQAAERTDALPLWALVVGWRLAA